ncbi:MAG: hypothetical protein VX546_09010 [Myxococcota bacterium]|nr:hypothetical protein [Myxococcota bacterium]
MHSTNDSQAPFFPDSTKFGHAMKAPYAGPMENAAARRFATTVATFLFYWAAFAVLYDYVGDGMIALSAFPIIVSGHLYGRWGGVLAGLSLAFVNYQLLDNAGRWPGPTEPGVPFAFASLALVGIGLQAGFFGESRRKVESEIHQRERTEQQLRSALEEVHTLRGIVPICAGCKQIRKDDGSWVAVERFIQERSEASFSHGVCPNCAAEQGMDA